MAAVYDDVEIEDMDFDEEKKTYFFPCPCGDKFFITLVSKGGTVARHGAHFRATKSAKLVTSPPSSLPAGVRPPWAHFDECSCGWQLDMAGHRGVVLCVGVCMHLTVSHACITARTAPGAPSFKFAPNLDCTPLAM